MRARKGMELSAGYYYRAQGNSWLDKERVVSWSSTRLVLSCVGFSLALLLSFSSGAWLGNLLDTSTGGGRQIIYYGAIGDGFEHGLYDGDSLEPVEEAEVIEKAADPVFTRAESYTFRKNDNLNDALQRFGVSHATALKWFELAKPYYDLARVKPGQSFELALDENDNPALFVLNISDSRRLVIEPDGAGWKVQVNDRAPENAPEVAEADGSSGHSLVPVQFRYVDGSLEVQDPISGKWITPEKTHVNSDLPADKAVPVAGAVRRHYSGQVKDSFYRAAAGEGLNPSQIMEVIDIFACDVDFRRDIRSGDSFRVLLGNPALNYRPGEKIVVLAAMIETSKSPHWAYYYRDEAGRSAYYDDRGNSLKGFNLICPVNYKRISSGYSYRRLHPKLRIYRPHLAVDYATSYGASVRAAAEGTIVALGWSGGYGRRIDIRHNSKYSTFYGHLSGYAGGLKKGSRVRQGQIIGYVGSSGLSTGPHLHYAVFRYGNPINPLRFSGEKGSMVANLNDFMMARSRLMTEMERVAQAGGKNSIYTSSASSY